MTKDIIWALAATDDEVGPACMNVLVPPTIAMDEAFREPYVQGYRHALAGVRKYLASVSPPSEGTLSEAQINQMRATALEMDIHNARELLMTNGYTVSLRECPKCRYPMRPVIDDEHGLKNLLCDNCTHEEGLAPLPAPPASAGRDQ